MSGRKPATLLCPSCGCSAKVRQEGPWCQCQRCFNEFPAASAKHREGDCPCKPCTGGNQHRMEEARKGYKEALQAGQVGRLKLNVTRAIEAELEGGGIDE